MAADKCWAEIHLCDTGSLQPLLMDRSLSGSPVICWESYHSHSSSVLSLVTLISLQIWPQATQPPPPAAVLTVTESLISPSVLRERAQWTLRSGKEGGGIEVSCPHPFYCFGKISGEGNEVVKEEE
jgi:hypothetical protein